MLLFLLFKLQEVSLKSLTGSQWPLFDKDNNDDEYFLLHKSPAKEKKKQEKKSRLVFIFWLWYTGLLEHDSYVHTRKLRFKWKNTSLGLTHT